MRHECFDPNELDEILAASPDDPRLSHADECPGCRALLVSYRMFMNPEKLTTAAERDAARPHLAAFLRREIGGGRDTPGERSARPFSASPRRRFPFLGLRPALAAAALLLVVLALPRLLDRSGGPPVSGVLREEGESPAFRGDAAALGNGDVALAWNAATGADGYRVVLYGGDLAEVVRFDAGADTSLVLTAEDMPADRSRPPRLWRVVALARGDEIARTELFPFPVPEP